MTKCLCILGRLPKLGIAELESLYGADNLRPVGSAAALLDIEPPQIDFSRLGGTVKFCKVLAVLDTTAWKEIEKFLKQSVPRHIGSLPEGKMKFGLSLYGLDVNVQHINTSALALKKIIKATGRSVRVVPNTAPALNSAQVLHNKLTSALGWELVFVRDGKRTIVAQNIAEQDIEAYAARDQARPKRDAHVGMLPPKLAQTIVNLAVGKIERPESRDQSLDCSNLQTLNSDLCVLDPFCGTGVMLQEAILMGYGAYGTDIDKRMIEYTKTNLDWLQEKEFGVQSLEFRVEPGDATSYVWKEPFNFVASELYLGRPFSTQPGSEVLHEAMQDVNTITKKFLKNLAKQTKPGFRLCIAIPAWSSTLRDEPSGSDSNERTKDNFKHLPLLDNLEELGYNRVSFVHASNEELIYYREDQIVARELVTLVRK